MLEYLTLGEFVVAMLMSLAALCAFVWGAATGAFQGVEAIKHQVLKAEGIRGAQCEHLDAGLGPRRPRRADDKETGHEHRHA